MAQVTIITGSASDRPVVDPVIELLRSFNVEVELHVASAHRAPDKLASIIKKSEETGTVVFIAAAGMAAHLAGAVAARTTKPVIGLPVASGPLGGNDSLLSTVMMPPGIPVATVGIDGGKNAAWLALQILALLPGGDAVGKKLKQKREEMRLSLDDAETKWVNDLGL
jgi:5-(carboxyamino)imidazole ribonucleotide mutase